MRFLPPGGGVYGLGFWPPRCPDLDTPPSSVAIRVVDRRSHPGGLGGAEPPQLGSIINSFALIHFGSSPDQGKINFEFALTVCNRMWGWLSSFGVYMLAGVSGRICVFKRSLEYRLFTTSWDHSDVASGFSISVSCGTQQSSSIDY